MTQRGPAIGVEAFDAYGALILHIFGYRKGAAPVVWKALCASLPTHKEVTAETDGHIATSVIGWL